MPVLSGIAALRAFDSYILHIVPVRGVLPEIIATLTRRRADDLTAYGQIRHASDAPGVLEMQHGVTTNELLRDEKPQIAAKLRAVSLERSRLLFFDRFPARA